MEQNRLEFLVHCEEREAVSPYLEAGSKMFEVTKAMLVKYCNKKGIATELLSCLATV